MILFPKLTRPYRTKLHLYQSKSAGHCLSLSRSQTNDLSGKRFQRLLIGQGLGCGELIGCKNVSLAFKQLLCFLLIPVPSGAT